MARKLRVNNMKALSVIAIVATIVTKILGLIREMMISGALGATPESDAYNISYMLVVTVFGLFSSAYGNSLVPTLAKLYSNEKNKLNSILSSILAISISVIILIIITMCMKPKFFVMALASGANEETVEIAARLVKVSSWSLIALIVISSCEIILRIFDSNIAPSLATIAFPVPILALLFLQCRDVDELLLALVAGYYLQALILSFFTLKKTTFRFTIKFDFKSDYIFDFFSMMPPLLFSSGLLQINTLVDNQVASGFGVGSVTALQQASKVNALAYTVFATTLMQIIYAKLTKSYASGDRTEFKSLISQQITLILCFIIPCAIIIPMYSNEIIEMLFLRGNYTIETARVAGSILRGYGCGLIVFVLRDILVYIYYSAQNSAFPSKVNCVAVLINVVLNITLSNFMGIKGIAYATSLSACVSFIVLLCNLKNKIMPIELIRKTDIFYIVLAAFVCFFYLKISKSFLNGLNVWLNLVPFAASFLIFWGGFYFLKRLFKSKK